MITTDLHIDELSAILQHFDILTARIATEASRELQHADADRAQRLLSALNAMRIARSDIIDARSQRNRT